MYYHDILALDAIIHATSLSSCPFHKRALHSLCLWIPMFKVLHLFCFCEGMWGMTVLPVSYRGMYEIVCIYSSCWLDHCTFHSPQIKFAHLRLPNHSDFHCILMRCRGPRHSPLDMAFPFNKTTCDRVRVYLPPGRIWNSIAIIKRIRASNAVGTQS